MIIKVRRGLEANRLNYTPQLGEPVFTTDTKELYIGDGVTPGGIKVDVSGGTVQSIIAGDGIHVDVTDPANPIVSVIGGGGAVSSVNGQIGDVELDADDIDDTSTTHKFATAEEKTKLGHISVSQTVDLDTMESTLASHVSNTSNPHSVTKAQIGLSNVPNTDFTAAVAANTAKNSYPSADALKLAGIEAGADVTDTANVTAAGALMDSEVENLAAVKSFDPSDYATATQGGKADSAVQPGDLATVATTGDYDDLSNTPTIPNSVDDLSPSQAGNSGKFLKTNGTTASWESIPGGGDMLAATYDPTGKNADAFSMGNMVETSTKKIMSDTERSKLSGIEAGADVTDATNVDAAGATMNTDTNVKSNSWVLDQDNMSGNDDTKVPTQQSVKAYVDAAIASMRIPVGGLYFSTDSTNPATSLGYGTWSAFGAGRVPVGYDSGQTEFNTDEKTGGAKTHTLTVNEMPAHNHPMRFGNPAGGDGTGYAYSGTAGTGTSPFNPLNVGGGQAHNNLQPYIVVRMWKRTA